MQMFTVGELCTYLRELLDSDEIVCDIWVKGELSSFKQAASGHCYFTLKEGNAVINAAMWRSYASRLTELPANGDEVLAHGRVSFYEARGDMQLYVDTMKPSGVGVLHARFEELKERLEREGWFDESRKRQLPALPHRIGVVTSSDGAALRDIVTVLSRRCPLVEVVVSPCLVQGDHAPASIIAALDAIYTAGVDVVILARGGGSLEDLWSFNEEIVARALFACPVPLITGMGHETDTTIVDYIADVRAPTPSAAAELAVPEMDELAAMVFLMWQRLDAALGMALDTRQSQLDHALVALHQHAPMHRITYARQQVDDLLARATTHIKHRVQLQLVQVQNLNARLATLNPYATLERGYAVVQQEGGGVVTHASQVKAGDRLIITLRDGQVVVNVSVNEGEVV